MEEFRRESKFEIKVEMLDAIKFEMHDAIGQHEIMFVMHGRISTRDQVRYQGRNADAIKVAIGHDAIEFEMPDTIKHPTPL